MTCEILAYQINTLFQHLFFLSMILDSNHINEENS